MSELNGEFWWLGLGVWIWILIVSILCIVSWNKKHLPKNLSPAFNHDHNRLTKAKIIKLFNDHDTRKNDRRRISNTPVFTWQPIGTKIGSMALQPHLLVEDHVHAMGLDVDRVLPHELQDVLDASRVGQASEADAVASAAGRRKEGSRGEHRHGHDGWRRERGDQRSGQVAVQHLENVEKQNKTNGGNFEYMQWTQNF